MSWTLRPLRDVFKIKARFYSHRQQFTRSDAVVPHEASNFISCSSRTSHTNSETRHLPAPSPSHQRLLSFISCDLITTASSSKHYSRPKEQEDVKETEFNLCEESEQTGQQDDTFLPVTVAQQLSPEEKLFFLFFFFVFPG